MPLAGRFAPSPTGPLHLGSLATALASWLDARANGYAWYVRMEDLDAPREEPGAAATILEQLRHHGLTWDHWCLAEDDGSTGQRGVLFQRGRLAVYQKVLAQLIAQGRAYPCSCSRKKLQSAVDYGKASYNPDGEILYPGFCRPSLAAADPLARPSMNSNRFQDDGMSWRFRNDNGDDFVLKRADGFWAYNFAVVIDDAFQDITDIIRGDDLIHAGPRHTALRKALGYPEPRLMHVPVVRNDLGEKLSKQTLAMPLRTDNSETIRLQLECAWSHLELTMPMRWIARVRPTWRRHYREHFHRLPTY